MPWTYPLTTDLNCKGLGQRLPPECSQCITWMGFLKDQVQSQAGQGREEARNTISPLENPMGKGSVCVLTCHPARGGHFQY